jgi:hypothetical protein
MGGKGLQRIKGVISEDRLLGIIRMLLKEKPKAATEALRPSDENFLAVGHR